MYSTHSISNQISPTIPKIVVLGMGGGGSNAVNRMIEGGMQGVTFVAANTDAQALAINMAPNKIQLGPKLTRGLGAGGLPTVGESAAEESSKELASYLQGADMVFLTAGMGGGTGTGSISIAAKVAKACGAVTVAIVTKPFSFELGRRQSNANSGIEKLKEYTDTLIVIPNDKLLEVAPRDLPLEMAFTLADDVLRQGVQGISELITETGLINVDFSHIKNIMTRGGGALMSIGTGSGPDKVHQAIEKALHHPLLDDIDLYSASGMIANFTGSENMSFRDVTDALKTLQNATGGHADIIPGIITDPRMEDRVQLILIVTGIGAPKANFQTDSFSGLAQSQVEEPRSFETETKQVHEEPIEKTEIGLEQYPQVDSRDNLSVPAFLRRRVKK
ncbi:MAG: cell division protein FtsZ [Anaerolineaceae bacterium]|nr:cell division protein FtsZ [Anaerolineaceae bacterium]MDD4041942.1 cell division protein FtsZ [Anaerolineaceae bacterium]MDD4578131.1 cell division protein FtsZ [Anaerolineaceae bacterium]